MKEIFVYANGLRFSCLEAGSGEKLALLLHGFPDDAGSMRGLMQRFVDRGYRAVAPYLRGYGATASAPDGRYRLDDLGADALELITALGHDSALLVGHDWGAMSVYSACTQDAARVDGAVMMALPPFACVQANWRHAAKQARNSWYIGFFQVPAIPERVIRRKDFAFIEKLWRDWSPGWAWDPQRMREVKRTFATAGTLDAALQYYRQLKPSSGALREYADMREQMMAPVDVRGLVLAGRDDGCMCVEVFDGAESSFAPGSALRIIDSAGHFMHLEQEEAVWSAISDWLN